MLVKNARAGNWHWDFLPEWGQGQKSPELEAISSRLEAIVIRLEAIASRFPPLHPIRQRCRSCAACNAAISACSKATAWVAGLSLFNHMVTQECNRIFRMCVVVPSNFSLKGSILVLVLFHRQKCLFPNWREPPERT